MNYEQQVIDPAQVAQYTDYDVMGLPINVERNDGSIIDRLPPSTHYLDTVEGPHSPGDELAHHLSRIAIAYEVTPDSESGQLRESMPKADAEDYGMAVYRGGTPAPEAVFEIDGAKQKIALVDTISRHVSLHALRNITPHEDRGQARIDWAGVAQGLVAEAAATDDKAEREQQLLAGIASSQFAEDDKDRITFLMSVYDAGLQEEAAEVCLTTEIVLLTDAPQAVWGSGAHLKHTLHKMQDIAPAFTIEPAQAQEHLRGALARMAGRQHEDKDSLPSAKKLHKQLTTHSQESEEHAVAREQAEQASVVHEKSDGILFDPYKIERFALQGLFIHDQAVALFGENASDIKDSPFARALRGKRDNSMVLSADDIRQQHVIHVPDIALSPQEQMSKHITELENDIIIVFLELSDPVVGRYSLEGVDTSDYSKITEEQMRAARFKVVVGKMSEQIAISRFANLEKFYSRDEAVKAATPEIEIYTNSEDGAASPDAVASSILSVVDAAYKFSTSEGGTVPTPENLLEGLQKNRLTLLQAATQNSSELISKGKRIVDPVDVVIARVSDEVEGHEQSDELSVKIKNNMPAKGSLDMYAAITLGCPALHEIHAARSQLKGLDRVVYGSANFIDHVLAASFQEAYDRGLLDIKAYQEERRAVTEKATGEAQYAQQQSSDVETLYVPD